MDWYRLFNGRLIGPFIRRRVRVTVEGRENLPRAGACILAMGSHTTEVESLVVAATLQERKLRFYAKADYWNRKGLRGRVQRWFMDAVGNIPMKRGQGRAVLEAIEAGVEVLRRGEVLAVYPEGTRVSDGKVHAAHLGTADTLLKAHKVMFAEYEAKLAKYEAKLAEAEMSDAERKSKFAEYKAELAKPRIPIVPVGLMYMGTVSAPKGGFVPVRGEVLIRIGQPMFLSPMELRSFKNGGRLAQRMLREEVSRRMMRRIARLCEKEYDPGRLTPPRS